MSRITMNARLVASYFAVFFVLIMVGIQPSHGQALPSEPQPTNVNRMISGTLQDGFRSRGFAANDPRFGNTVARAAPALSIVAGGAAGVVAAGITAPAWASVALGLAVGSVVTYAVTLAIDGIASWFFGDDSVDVVGDPTNVDGAGILLGGAYWSVGSPRGVIYGGDGIAVAREAYSLLKTQNEANNSSDPDFTIAEPNCSVNVGIATCVAVQPDKYGGTLSTQALYYSSGAPSSCLPGGYFVEASGCVPYTFPQEVEDLTGVSVQTAIDAIPEADLNKPLNPAIGAALANRAWQQAASQPGYDGLPYPQSNPITEAEVSNWMQANPEYAPSVQDFVYPNPAPNSETNPWALPSNPTASNPSPAIPNESSTNPGSENPVDNLGPDPGIGSPQLEQVPTAEQIIAPLRGLFSDVDSFSVPTQSGECPRPSFDVFGQQFVMASHCELLDDNLAFIRAACLVMFALGSLIIVLRA